MKDGTNVNNKPDPAGSPSRRTVLVTRPVAQSRELVRLLEERGLVAIPCPTIQIAPSGDSTPLDRAISQIDTYNWIVFTSANGVQFFLRRFQHRRGAHFRPTPGQSICAIGPATAASLRSAGVSVGVVARHSRSEGVLNELVECVRGEAAINGLRFLLPSARDAREFLPEELRKMGATVDVVEAYRTIKPIGRLEGAFNSEDVVAIAFTSPSTVNNFVEMLDEHQLAELREAALAACIGPVTAAAAVDQGFKRTVIAKSTTSTALVEIIIRSLSVG